MKILAPTALKFGSGCIVMICVSGSNVVNARSICESLPKNALFGINQNAPDSGRGPGGSRRKNVKIKTQGHNNIE